MISRRLFVVAGSAAGLYAALGRPRPARGAQLSDGATALVRDFIDKGIALLDDRSATVEQRTATFRAIIEKYFAADVIARWVLGRYGRAITPEQWREYRPLFEDLIVYGYVKRFSEYSGERVDIVRTLPTSATSATVYSEIKRPSGGRPIGLDWRVGERDGLFKITDVIIEGASLSQTWRSDFAATLQNGGIPNLLATLRTKVAQLKADLAAGR